MPWLLAHPVVGDENVKCMTLLVMNLGEFFGSLEEYPSWYFNSLCPSELDRFAQQLDLEFKAFLD